MTDDEMAEDIADFDAAMAEGGPAIPWAQVKADLGWDDIPERERIVWENQQVRESLARGLAEAAEGKSQRMDWVTEGVDIDEDDDELAARFEAYEPKPEDERDPEPLKRLQSAIAASARAELEIAKAVGACRDADYSWAAIGGQLGWPADAVRYKYGSFYEPDGDSENRQVGE